MYNFVEKQMLNERGSKHMGDQGKHNVKGHYRTRNGKTEYVRQHERGNRGTTQNDNKASGDLSPLAKAIIGGILLFCLAQAGLGWIGDAIENVKDTAEKVQTIGEIADNIGKTNKGTSPKEINEKGFTVEFDIDDIEASDVQEILEYLHNHLMGNQDIDDNNVIYLSTEVFKSAENYKAAVLNRLWTIDDEQVAFVVTYNNVSENKKEAVYSNAKEIIQNNNSAGSSEFTDVKIDALYGAPSDKDLTIVLRFYTVK